MAGRHLVLVGLMGSGKSTVGPLVAERLGRPFVDLDAAVEARSGTTVPELFAERGEAAFRSFETDTLRDTLAGPTPTVVAAGGGAVVAEANRTLLAGAAQVVWLRARPETLVARVGDGGGRPLLGADPAGALARLAVERASAYAAAADAVVDVDGRSPGEVAEDVVALADRANMPGMHTVTVDLGARSYPVHVGPGALDRLPELLPAEAARVAIVTQAGIPVEIDPGRPHEVVHMGEGESAKTLATVEELCRAFARQGLTRADAVVAVGGGVVTDTAGFAAASYHRGVAVVHVATTLLAQVDAAIGGKTGVNLPEGKNLVGAFWQPRGVVCDTDVLVTLPPRELRCGLGEVAKYHFLTGDDLGALDLPDRVARCVEIKAEVVAGDEREGGRRALLNYGHTLGHALETAGGYDLMHGEAVGIGLVYAAHLARRLGRIGDGRVDQHRAVVAGYDLPVSVPPGLDPDELVALMARDKKALHGLTFALDGPAGVEVVPDVPADQVRAALLEVR